MSSHRRSLQAALIISLIVHTGIFFLPHLKFLPSQEQSKKIELTYLNKKPDQPITLNKPLKRDISLKEKESEKRDIRLKVSEPQWRNPVDTPSIARPLSSPLTKEVILKSDNELFKNKPQLIKPDVIAVKKRIALTPLEVNKISNPSYISYYQIIREKIRRCAYQNYTSQETGEVYLSFVVSSNGSLAKTKVIEEKSTTNAYLKEIALKSLNDASSFPTFPDDLDYPELSFNVIISFEIE